LLASYRSPSAASGPKSPRPYRTQRYRRHLPTVRNYDAPKGRFSATLGEEPEVEVGLV
jgi:hypothetical protein